MIELPATWKQRCYLNVFVGWHLQGLLSQSFLFLYADSAMSSQLLILFTAFDGGSGVNIPQVH